MTTDTVGGVWTFTKELTTELLRRGHSVALVTVGPEPSPEQLAFTAACQRKFTGGFTFAMLPAPLEWMPENAAAYDAAQPHLLDLCRMIKPDVLLLSQFCFGALPVSQPKIITAHSDVLSWAEAVGKAPLVQDAWLSAYRTLVQRGLKSADAVIAPTQSMLKDLNRGFTICCRTAVIPNGRSVPATGTRPDRSMQAITAGRLWDEAKNTRLLTEIKSPFPLYIAGDSGSNELHHIGELRFLGKLTEQEMLHHLRASAICICTSLYEPFGLAPLEAALCGCAVLANNIPSLREVWADGALYFHDAGSLSTLLHTLNDDPGQLEAAQMRSRERAAQYTSARMADGYLQLASHLAALHRRAAHAA